MKKVIFYTQLGHRSCDAAYRILMEVAWDVPLEIDVVDISHAHNEEARAKYADRIPVITSPDGKTELEWPFTLDEVKLYLINELG